ncbi:hypothetical protein GCM10010245_85390 [Streptomyces spectabilis]|nr:hypothetical protein GCM10010245_85390 [Streptomyces spectabilis]
MTVRVPECSGLTWTSLSGVRRARPPVTVRGAVRGGWGVGGRGGGGGGAGGPPGPWRPGPGVRAPGPRGGRGPDGVGAVPKGAVRGRPRGVRGVRGVRGYGPKGRSSFTPLWAFSR